MATAPLRGESLVDLLPGLRHLALDRAVYWFRPRAEQRDIQVLAVFFGGQDHQRRMLVWETQVNDVMTETVELRSRPL